MATTGVDADPGDGERRGRTDVGVRIGQALHQSLPGRGGRGTEAPEALHREPAHGRAFHHRVARPGPRAPPRGRRDRSPRAPQTPQSGPGRPAPRRRCGSRPPPPWRRVRSWPGRPVQPGASLRRSCDGGPAESARRPAPRRCPGRWMPFRGAPHRGLTRQAASAPAGRLGFRRAAAEHRRRAPAHRQRLVSAQGIGQLAGRHRAYATQGHHGEFADALVRILQARGELNLMAPRFRSRRWPASAQADTRAVAAAAMRSRPTRVRGSPASVAGAAAITSCSPRRACRSTRSRSSR